jgi:hypothetical protein
MNPKYLILILPVLIIATSAMADLELTVDIQYPRGLELKIPVQENSDFEMHTSFSHGEFFTATGHVGRITGLNTNRSISLTYGYEYNLANGRGSATGSTSQGLNDKYSLRIVTSIWSANPRFTVHEVPAPVSPNTRFTNMVLITNVTGAVLTNATKNPAQPSSSPEHK